MQIPKLKYWREKRFLTQAELAARTGIAQATIARLEKGRHLARFSTIKKLASALHVAPEALVES